VGDGGVRVLVQRVDDAVAHIELGGGRDVLAPERVARRADEAERGRRDAEVELVDGLLDGIAVDVLGAEALNEIVDGREALMQDVLPRFHWSDRPKRMD